MTNTITNEITTLRELLKAAESHLASAQAEVRESRHLCAAIEEQLSQAEEGEEWRFAE